MLSRALALLCTLSACRSAAKTEAGPDARPPPPTRVELRLRAPGWNLDAMERQALVPVETALRHAPGLVGTEATVVTGAAFVTLTFEPSTTTAAAQRTVADVARSLPPEVAVEVVPAATAELRFTLRSETLPMIEVREIAERVVLPRLGRVPGSIDTRGCGGARRQATVFLDADRVAGARIGLREVTAALARPTPYDAVTDIGAVVIATRGGAPVRVSDVARIEDGGGPGDCWTAAGGRMGVEGIVTFADPQALAAAGAALDAARAELPAAVALERPPEPTVRLTVQTAPGATDAALVHGLTALRDVAPTAVAWRDLRGAAPGELELRVPAATVDAVSRALSATSMVGPVRTPDDEIQIALAGPDLEPLAAGAQAVRGALPAAAAGIVGASRDSPRFDVKPDPATLARLGVAAADLDAYVRAATRGIPVALVRDGTVDFPVVARFARDPRDFQALGKLMMVAGGAAVPIGAVARIEMSAEPREILHRDGERIALIWIRPGPGADRRAMRMAAWAAASKVQLPPGVRLLGP